MAMELLRLALAGGPRRVTNDNGASAIDPMVAGVDVTGRDLDGSATTVVQLLLDDDDPRFDHSLLDGPLVAEIVDAAGAVIGREPFDHDRFRRQLRAEREAG